MSYQWVQVNNPLPAILAGLDGVGCAVLNNKVYACGGWSSSGATYNNVSMTADGAAWTASAKARPWNGRHAMPVVAHNGRIFVLGGDQNSGAYQPGVYSWNGSESSNWVTETINAPWGNRAGHVAFSYGGYLWVGFGQSIRAFDGQPTKFFTDLWRSPTGQGNTWELFSAECASGYRGYISGQAVVHDGEVYFIGGGCYESSDFPTREMKNDVYVMDASFNFRLVNHGKGSNLTKMLYHTVHSWDGYLWVIGGHNASDRNTVFRSVDGKQWEQMPTPPWTGRHAATSFVFNDEIYFGGGAYTSDMWKLKKVVTVPGQHIGATPDGTTALASTYTIVDKANPLTPGSIVKTIGLHRMSSGSIVPKIFRQIGTGNSFDVVASHSAVSHPGGGYFDCDIPDFTVPNNGSNYFLGFAFSYPYADSFAHAGPGRWMKAGNITGNGQAINFYSDGSICTKWTE